MTSLKRVLPYLRSYWLVIVVGLVTVVLPVAMELVVPRMLQFVIDQGIRAGDMDNILRGSLIMLVAAVVGALATIGQGVCRAQLSQGLAYDLRNDLFAHIQSFSFGNLDQMQTGQLMTRISSDVDVVRLFSSAGISLLLRALLMILGSVIMLLITDWQLTLVVLLFIATAGGVISVFMRLAQPLFMAAQQKLAALNTAVQENLAGVQLVKAFVREKYEIDRFNRFNADYMNQNIKVGRLLALVMPIMTVITNVGTVAIIWLGGLDVIGGRLTVGELVAFNNYLMIGMAPLLLLSNILMMVSRAEVSAKRIFEVLDTEPLIQPAEVSYMEDTLAGAVEFEKVSFHYDGPSNGFESDRSPIASVASNGAGKNVLDGVSLKARPGERIAILGATGSGKSTLVHLIPRFYDVVEGAVCIDGVDVRDWAPASLRGQIGVVLQQTTLFSGTVRENIAFGRPDASLNAVIAAAKVAQAHDFIMAMPDGYDSMVEARGANLSGGQKQRIAIARALLITPRILILDDSTSSVDMDTEFRIQEALDEWLAGTTTFVVAQRISSVLNADQILILENGQIVAHGTHRELMQTSPIYRDILRSQFGDLLDGQL